MSTHAYREELFSELSQFIEFVELNCIGNDYLFRGQNCDWPLVPKIGRVSTVDDLQKTEQSMMEDFKRLSKPFLTMIPTNELEWLSLAQHHGMATRLLDWTTNPLAAAWFAVQKPCDEPFGIIWMFHAPETDVIKAGQAHAIDPYSGARSKIFQPSITTSRIMSQNGWFTLHKYQESKRIFIPFENNKLYNKKLTKIKMPKDSFERFRYHLDRLGINERSLFADLDSTARYVEWLHTLLEDEREE